MSREKDVRDLSVNRATPSRTSELNAVSSGVSADLPGGQRVRITQFDPTTGNPAVVVSEGASGEGQDYVRRALDHVQAISSVLGLTAQAAEFVADPVVPQTSSGARAVHLQQRYKGIPIFQAATTVRFAPNGALTETAGSTITIGADLPVRPRLTVQDAVLRAAQHVAVPDADEQNIPASAPQQLSVPGVDLDGFEPGVRVIFRELPEQPTVLEPGPFGADIKASLVWFPLGEDAALGWSVLLTLPRYTGQYQTIVDADTGDILYCHQRVRSVAAKGNVFRVNGDSGRVLTDFPRPVNDYGLPFPALTQENWRWCHKCQGLFFGGGAVSKCPAGDAHDSTGGFYFLVDSSPSYPGESNWRYCNKCQGLFFGAGTNKCPADLAAHNSVGSGDYSLPNTALAPGQPGWRRCTKCQGLFFGDNPGSKCPVSAGHTPASQRYSLLTIPSGLPAGFPDTWVNTNATQGNATDARRQSTNQPIFGAAQAGVMTFNPASATDNDQRVLNAFYYTCFMHDFFYLLGFREADGNFQQNNLGRGGSGGDRVQAQVADQFIDGFATMTTFAEGVVPGPMMLLGNVVQPDGKNKRHTAFDSAIVFHEFTHGVTDRLVGGPANVNALTEPQSVGMAEGWGDYIACTVNGTTVFAEWVSGIPGGIRRFPYDSNYPNHFGELGTGAFANGAEGGSGVPVHNIGEIWAATLLEMNRRTDKHLALQLVVDALKMCPANPSFLSMRDRVLQEVEDMLAAGRLNPAQRDGAWQGIWSAFCRFGMGPNAASNGAQLTGIVADFVLGEDNWRRCKKCQGLFFGGAASKCPSPAGSAHDGSQSANFDLVVNWPTNLPNPPGESGWARCKKCQGLFFVNAGSKCPAGSGHDSTGSSDYKLIFNTLGSPGQSGWLWCNKCQGLFFSENPTSVCPAGGQHFKTLDWNYSLLQR